MQVAFYLAGEITQVKESIPWVRCASGNVLLLHSNNLHLPHSSGLFFATPLITPFNWSLSPWFKMFLFCYPIHLIPFFTPHFNWSLRCCWTQLMANIQQVDGNVGLTPGMIYLAMSNFWPNWTFSFPTSSVALQRCLLYDLHFFLQGKPNFH